MNVAWRSRPVATALKAQQLLILRAVVSQGSFTRAAEPVHLRQPAVSMAERRGGPAGCRGLASGDSGGRHAARRERRSRGSPQRLRPARTGGGGGLPDDFAGTGVMAVEEQRMLNGLHPIVDRRLRRCGQPGWKAVVRR